MGALICKVVDTMLLLSFLVISMGIPLIDSQTVFQESLFPDLLVGLYKWVKEELQHYLMVEKPPFYLGVVWLMLVYLWPLALLNIYGILASKPWFKSTCLLSGSCIVAMMAPLFAEVLGSPKTTNKVLVLYLTLIGSGVLAIFRGLLLSPTTGKEPTSAKKKSV